MDDGSGIAPDSGDKGRTHFCVHVPICILTWWGSSRDVRKLFGYLKIDKYNTQC